MLFLNHQIVYALICVLYAAYTMGLDSHIITGLLSVAYGSLCLPQQK